MHNHGGSVYFWAVMVSWCPYYRALWRMTWNKTGKFISTWWAGIDSLLQGLGTAVVTSSHQSSCSPHSGQYWLFLCGWDASSSLTSTCSLAGHKSLLFSSDLIYMPLITHLSLDTYLPGHHLCIFFMPFHHGKWLVILAFTSWFIHGSSQVSLHSTLSSASSIE